VSLIVRNFVVQLPFPLNYGHMLEESFKVMIVTGK